MPPDSIPANKPKPIPIKTPPDLAVEYANLVRIAHSPSEIVFPGIA